MKNIQAKHSTFQLSNDGTPFNPIRPDQQSSTTNKVQSPEQNISMDDSSDQSDGSVDGESSSNQNAEPFKNSNPICFNEVTISIKESLETVWNEFELIKMKSQNEINRLNEQNNLLKSKIAMLESQYTKNLCHECGKVIDSLLFCNNDCLESHLM